jgi:ubiquinone/menaquinone biosynthesis C-methylase UbiE
MTEHPSGFFEATDMPAAGWWEALWPAPARVLDAVGLAPGMDVVDLCSGDGWFTLEIARRAGRVIAIDIDENMIALARTRLAERNVETCTFVTADAYDVAKHVAEPVDFVFLANAFHGVPDKPRLARAVHGVLKPAGRFAIVNWHRRPREETPVLGEPRGPRPDLRMSPEQTIAAVAPAGFKLSRIADVPPYHYGAIFHRPAS